jgi:hypothetical protein
MTIFPDLLKLSSLPPQPLISAHPRLAADADQKLDKGVIDDAIGGSSALAVSARIAG